MGTFGAAAADGVGVAEHVAEMSGWRMQNLTHQKEGLLGCSIGLKLWHHHLPLMLWILARLQPQIGTLLLKKLKVQNTAY